MDFNDTSEQAKFRAKCREWLEKNAREITRDILQKEIKNLFK